MSTYKKLKEMIGGEKDTELIQAVNEISSKVFKARSIAHINLHKDDIKKFKKITDKILKNVDDLFSLDF